MKRFTSVLLSLALAVPAGAVERPTTIEFARPLGMGGAFTAIADDHNIFTYNPAGMVQRTGAEVTILQVAPGVSEDTLEFKDFIDENEDKLKNFDQLTSQEQNELLNKIARDISPLTPRLYVAAAPATFVSGPIGESRFHLGFGALAALDANFRMDAGITVPTLSYEANADTVLPVALAKRFDVGGGRLGVGATAKFLRRGQIKEDRLSVVGLDDYSAPPLSMGNAFGGDLGLLYQPTKRVNVGLMVQDIGGTRIKFDSTEAEKGYPAKPERESVIRSQTNVGVALYPATFFGIIPTGERWVFAADLRDIFNKDEHVLFERGLSKPVGENIGTHVRLGAEYRWWFLRFRGGAYQGYPTFGIGLDIPLLKIDYAYYGRELGVFSGQIKQNNHIISLALRFGTGKVEARERISDAKRERKARRDAPAEMAEPGEPVPVEPAQVEAAPAEAPAVPETRPESVSAPKEPVRTPAKAEPAAGGSVKKTIGRPTSKPKVSSTTRPVYKRKKLGK